MEERPNIVRSLWRRINGSAPPPDNFEKKTIEYQRMRKKYPELKKPTPSSSAIPLIASVLIGTYKSSTKRQATPMAQLSNKLLSERSATERLRIVRAATTNAATDVKDDMRRGKRLIGELGRLQPLERHNDTPWDEIASDAELTRHDISDSTDEKIDHIGEYLRRRRRGK